MSPKEATILNLLIASGVEGMHGLGLIEKSNGILKRGTIYVTLARMEDKGYIKVKETKNEAVTRGVPRRIFMPTGHGASSLRQAALLYNGGALA